MRDYDMKKYLLLILPFLLLLVQYTNNYERVFFNESVQNCSLKGMVVPNLTFSR